MKKNKPFGELFYRSLKKTLLTMRIAVILMILGILQARANDAYSQKTMLSLNFSETELVKVLDKIEDESEFFFLYNEKLLDTERKVNIEAKDQLISVILDNLFAGTDVKYTIIDRKIILAPGYLTEVSQTQKFKVSGTIIDSKGEALTGVNVILKGTFIGANTDIEGRYTIEVSDGNGILVFSFIGFTSQEIKVNGSSKIDVKLSEEATALDEVVVTALGIAREAKSLTYSTQGINAMELTEARELNVVNSLRGKVAGLSITSSGSGLGADSRVVLRGDRSISGDSQPLYVIDGVPVRGGINTISPDNIASINVLKGPSAAALYGSDAQNGVIIIETRKGKADVVTVSLNNSFMVSQPVEYIDFQNEYGQGGGGIYNKSSELSWGPKMEGQMVDTWSLDPADAGKQYAFTPQPNNRKDAFQSGYNMATSILASAGSEKAQTAFSYTFTDAKGIIPVNTLQRHNVSLRVNSKLTQRLSLDSKIEYMQQGIKNQLNEGGLRLNPLRQIQTMPANISTEMLEKFEYQTASGIYQQNYWNPSTNSGENPYWLYNRTPHEDKRERVIAMTSLKYDFTDAFNLMIRGSYESENSSNELKHYNGFFTDAVFGRYTVGQSKSNMLNADFLLGYKKDITKDWSMNANFGGSIKNQVNNISQSSNTGIKLLVPNFFTISNTLLPVTSYNPGTHMENLSLYAFGQISWKASIYMDITGRNDWSSTLPPNSQSYFYPSVGMSAILSNLIPAFPKLFSFAKLRASWAKVGNSAPPYMLSRTASFRSGGKNGFLQFSNVLPNEFLKPETTESFEIGLDLRLLKGRLGFDVTAYKTNTYDQLFTVALPVGSGASSFFTNGGNIENKGLEVILKTVPLQKDFSWNLDLNFSLNRNMVLAISDERPSLVIGNSPYFEQFVIEQGRPYGEIYSRGFVRDAQGRVIIGTNGLPQITSGRTVNIGNAMPDWMGGMSNLFSFKNLSLSFYIEHRQGGIMGSMTNAILANAGNTKVTLQGREGGLIFGDNFFANETAILANGSPNNIPVNAETFWRYVGGENAPVGEIFSYDATYTRLSELTIGYSLPKSMLAKLGITSIRFSLVGRNLFYLYKASKNIEPGTTVGTSPSSAGYQEFTPPSQREFGANLKIDF